MNPKIVNEEKLKELVEKLKKKNKKIVTTNGVFDILHIGHVKYLEEAKAQGDILIVGLNSDASVKMNKGPKRPINSEESRAAVLAALQCVDYVTIFNEKDPRELLEIIQPAVHANGEEYGEDCIEAPVVRKYGGKIYLIKKYKDFSTTKLIEKIKEAYK